MRLQVWLEIVYVYLSILSQWRISRYLGSEIDVKWLKFHQTNCKMWKSTSFSLRSRSAKLLVGGVVITMSMPAHVHDTHSLVWPTLNIRCFGMSWRLLILTSERERGKGGWWLSPSNIKHGSPTPSFQSSIVKSKWVVSHPGRLVWMVTSQAVLTR